ncbi:MAG: hypothetical protein L0Y71_05945 [Gemmataceae bacterium]|nr:hypothetical protein [Gemmataceae bacterium]
MTYPHRIRLRGPWECEPLEALGGGVLPAPRRVTLPGSWGDLGLPGFAGRVRFVRKFGYPGRIDDYERVWLVGDGMEGVATLRLNDTVLATDQRAPFAVEVTPLLKRHNCLKITVSADSDRGGLWGNVALEIRCSAYLHDVHVRQLVDGSLEVTGAVTGTCDQPLELYGLADQAHAHYQQIEPRPEGAPFRMVLPPRDPPIQLLRVDIVRVSKIWGTWEHCMQSVVSSP